MRVRKIDDEHLLILHLESNEELARHKIPTGKGHLQKNNNHTRERSKKIPALMMQIASSFPNPLEADSFLKKIHKEKPRYIRDQLLLIQSAIKEQSPNVICKALDFCVKNKLYSAVDFRDAIIHYKKEQHNVSSLKEDIEIIPLSFNSLEKIKTKPQIRKLSDYSKVFE